MASIVATNVKKGQCIKYEGETGIVLNLEHRTPGKGNALIAATIRSFQTGKTKTILGTTCHEYTMSDDETKITMWVAPDIQLPNGQACERRCIFL